MAIALDYVANQRLTAAGVDDFAAVSIGFAHDVGIVDVEGATTI